MLCATTAHTCTVLIRHGKLRKLRHDTFGNADNNSDAVSVTYTVHDLV